jgi:hypothetical protein
MRPRLWRLLVALFGAAMLAAGTHAAAEIVPKETIEAALAGIECDTAGEENPAHGYTMDGELEALDLGEGKQLVPLVCWRAAYNYGFAFLLVEPASPGTARLLKFEHPKARGGSADTLTNFDYDAETKTLGEYSKGRGLGDCGGIGKWVWTGSDFALDAYWWKDECDGEDFDIADEWQIYPPR